MEFGVLGPVTAWTAGGRQVPVPGLKVRALLAVLLVHEGRPVPAARLIDALWGEDLPGDPAGTLSGKVTQLRRALESAEPGGRQLVASPPPGYRLLLHPEGMDVHRFRALTERARVTTSPRDRARLFVEALGLWRGPAFADFADEPFARSVAARLAEERLVAVEDHVEARLELGEHLGLVAELGELVAAHPLRERLRLAHLRALYRSGRPSEALDSYEDHRRHLADELGLDPGRDLVALHRAVLARDPSLDLAAPRRTNLPAPVSELIGREEPVAAVQARLASDRLVTLTGPGGVGKTRLALEVGNLLVDAFADGVWLAELGGLEPGADSRPADVVMAALDVRDLAGAGDRLVDALRSRRMLLVLDNCEHVVDQAAELAGRLLRGCPGLRVLATSREPLGLPGEVVWAVPPLDVPAAVRLFAARASAAAPGFALDADVTPSVEVLVRRLDGIPLALELAATRVRALGVDELVARLDDRFRLLATGRRDAPARQRTLAAMIDWSWDLLTEPERVVLRRLAIHADGCTLEAAERVCGLGDVASLLARLVDRSLVTVAHGPDGPRYRLLESVGAYCADRLAAAGEADLMRDRHGSYYTELAVRAERHLYGPEQREWLRRLDTETANLRTALHHASADRALRLVVALTWYWFLRGRLTEARRSLAAAVAVPNGSPLAPRAEAWLAGISVLLGDPPLPSAARVCEAIVDSVDRARAEWFLAYAEFDLGDLAAVDARLERALAGFGDAGDRWGLAAVLSTRARLGYLHDDPKAIERDGESSAELFRELGDRWGVLQATGRLAGLAEMTGELDRAISLNRESLRMAEELGLWPEVSVRLGSLGWIAMLQGDFVRARELCGRALRLAGEQGSRVASTFAELGLAFAVRRQGDLEVAERHLTGLLRAAGRSEPLHLGLLFLELGYVAERRGLAEEAERLQRRAYEHSSGVGTPRVAAMALEGLAAAVALAGDHSRSARLLGAAASARLAATSPAAPAELAEIDRVVAAARTALGSDGFDAAYLEGTAGTLEDVMAGWGG